jgi:choline dehydrogenase-like flavoprotein
MTQRYDVIIVGTGFASSFFLMRYLEKAPQNSRVLVLERGDTDTKAWQLENHRTSSIAPEDVFVNHNPEKVWFTSPGFGGNSNCWMAGTTRMMPGDFELRSRYGVGSDWPMKYDDLEGHYGVVEEVMLVSGPADSPMPRSKPYPLPPHRFSDPDAALKAKFPTGWYQMSTARASVATGKRGICCATGICSLCPVDAKFTIQNGLASIYADPRVTLQLRCEVESVDIAATVAKGVVYTTQGRTEHVQGDLIVLGASALFNPHILLRSGITHPWLGKGLHEQMPIDVTLDLGGMKAYNGSTLLSGLGYLFYEGNHRREYAAAMIETWSSPFHYMKGALRLESGRWNERFMIRFLIDDLPRQENYVSVNPTNPRLADVHFAGYSDYASRGAAQVPKMIDKLAEALPIERVVSTELGGTSAHIQGTVVMGNDPADSIVDRYLVHHQIRNLLVLGCSSFPTASPAYPTLSASALSLWAADNLFNSGVKA